MQCVKDGYDWHPSTTCRHRIANPTSFSELARNATDHACLAGGSQHCLWQLRRRRFGTQLNNTVIKNSVFSTSTAPSSTFQALLDTGSIDHLYRQTDARFFNRLTQTKKTEFLITVLFSWVPNLLRRNCQRRCREPPARQAWSVAFLASSEKAVGFAIMWRQVVLGCQSDGSSKFAILERWKYSRFGRRFLSGGAWLLIGLWCSVGYDSSSDTGNNLAHGWIRRISVEICSSVGNCQGGKSCRCRSSWDVWGMDSNILNELCEGF